MILDTIKKTIVRNGLISSGDSVLIGLSGGADSVCLTHVLWSLKEELGITLYTAHVNHGIRHEEADSDEKFVRSFSDLLGIECFVKKIDIPEIAKRDRVSEEAAGRCARYGYFEQLCKSRKITKIATAHNKNDSVETVLMNFSRGSALNGLCGIPYRRADIIRPLLDITRADIEAYCSENKLKYVTDSTNLKNDYTRNKLRNVIIPMIQQELNPNLVNTISKNSVLIREDNEYLESRAKEIYQKNVSDNGIMISVLNETDISLRRRVVRYMLDSVYDGLCNIYSVYVDDILSIIGKQSGTVINLPDSVTARNEYGKLIIERQKPQVSAFFYDIKVGDFLYIPEINAKVSVKAVKTVQNDGALYFSGEDISKITVRSRKSGDSFLPQGMSGTKKVKEYFIDKKIPRCERNKIPVIEINGKIAAVGNRYDSRFVFKDMGIRVNIERL